MEPFDGKEPEMRNERPHQEGMALVLAIMVLLVLTVIGAALMANVNTETKISGLKVQDTQALQAAEAGVQEALLRLRNGDVNDDMNPRRVTVIFNQVAGSLPPVGTDTTAIPTLQPSGAYLNYSTANKSPNMLVVKYKTKGSPGVIQRYDDTANPKINGTTGNAIWSITSTGTAGGATRTIYTEVCRQRFNILARGAVTAKVGIQFKGNIKVCGHNHRYDTPLFAQPGGGGGSIKDCDGPYTGPMNDGWWDTNVHGACMPGTWSEKVADVSGSATVFGEPANTRDNQSGFYSGPWDALGMTQTDFWSWVGAPRTVAPNPPKGILYIDNDAVKQNGGDPGNNAGWSYTGGNGEGLLYVDGDLHINGNFTYKGMVYVEGNLTLNGNLWILGGLIVKGKTVLKITNGSAVLLYSAEAMQQNITKYGGNMRTIAWKEL
jgi:Tfp pilus assembly protein PilX